MFSSRFVPFALLALAALLPRNAAADSITVSAHSATTTTFDAVSASGNLSFSLGNLIILNGLTNVTGVTLSSNAAAFGSVVYTANSVIFTVTHTTAFPAGSPLDLPLFTVTSSTPATTNLSYSLQESGATFNGTVQNNVITATPTPEPSSILLLLPGALGAAALVRRRLASGGPDTGAEV